MIKLKTWTAPLAIVITGSLCLTSVSAVAAETPVVEETASTVVADSINKKKLEEAIKKYDATNTSSVTDLVDTVTPEDAIDIDKADHVDIDTNNGWLNAGTDEDSTIGMKLAGTNNSEVVDDTAVSHDPENGIEAVGRATEDGAQIVTVIDNEQAAQEVEYALNLPKDAILTPLADGSVAVSAPIETEVFLPGEDTRVDEEINKIVGSETILDDLENLSDEQWDQIMAIPDAKTKTVVETQQIATIETPWAVDAEGNALDTEYVVEGDTLVQKIHTDENTVFPVIADPSWWKFEWKWDWSSFGSCVAKQLGIKAATEMVKVFNEPKVRKALKSKQWKVASSIAYERLKKVSPKIAKVLIKKAANLALPGGVVGIFVMPIGKCAFKQVWN